MANIRQFDTPALSLRPSETGVESTAGAARRMGAFYNQVGGATEQLGSFEGSLINQTGNRFGSALQAAGDEYVKYEDNKQISHGAAVASDMFVNLEKQWNDSLKGADPNDPSVAAKFKETVLAPELEKFGGNFTTENSQKFAEGITQRYRSHFDTKIAADMSTMAGIAAKENAAKTINSLSSAVYLDPSSLDTAIDTLKHSAGHIVDSSPTIDAETGARVKFELSQKGIESLVKSAVSGMIQKNPDVDLDGIQKKYGEYINGPEIQTFKKAAQTYARLQQSETRSQRVMADYTAKQDFHKAANDLELSTAPANPGDSPTLPKDYWDKVRQLGQMPGASLEPGRLKSMVENGERITARLGKPEPLAPISHATTIDLLTRMRANDDTRLANNDDIYKAYGDGKLNTADFNFLNKEFKEMRSPEGDALSKDRTLFFKQYAGAITGNMYDPVQGSPKMYTAEMNARRMESDLRRKGLDPHLAYDPASEYFIGKPERLAKFAGSMQDDLATKATQPAAAAEKPSIPDTPKNLMGIASLSYSKARGLYRDDTTGKLYKPDGTEAK